MIRTLKHWYIALIASSIAAASFSALAADASASSPAAAPLSNGLVVVVEKYTALPKGKGTPFFFQIGSVITIDRSSVDGLVHVDSLASGIHQKGDFWIPRKYVATPESFKRLVRWNGAKRATWDEGPDVVYYYALNPNGTFGFLSDEDSKVTPAVAGHMYRFKNILWMRESNGDIGSDRFFLILPNGDLCEPNPVPCDGQDDGQ